MVGAAKTPARATETGSPAPHDVLDSDVLDLDDVGKI